MSLSTLILSTKADPVLHYQSHEDEGHTNFLGLNHNPWELPDDA
jgi:hypothetical protein